MKTIFLFLVVTGSLARGGNDSHEGEKRTPGFRPRAPEVAPYVGGEHEKAAAPFTDVVGRFKGCTGTIVSPPGAEVTAVIYASHCKGMRDFVVGKQQFVGGEHFSNRQWVEGEGTMNPYHQAGHDVAIAFFDKPFESKTKACLKSGPPLVKGDALRILGFGHPENSLDGAPHPQVTELLTGLTKVSSFAAKNGAILAVGAARVSQGDSGGPVVDPAADAGVVNVRGINSLLFSPDPSKKILGSVFAPMNEATFDFLARAAAAYGKKHGRTPKICGVEARKEEPDRDRKEAPDRDRKAEPVLPVPQRKATP